MGTINNSSSGATSQTESERESFAVGCHLVYVGIQIGPERCDRH